MATHTGKIGGFKKTYKYHDNGSIKEENYYNGKNIRSKTVYDQNGAAIEYQSQSLNTHLHYIFKNDEHGNRIEETHYDKNGVLMPKVIMEYEYDKLGNWIKLTQSYDGKIQSITTRTIEYY